jgi:hypothetical protein
MLRITSRSLPASAGLASRVAKVAFQLIRVLAMNGSPFYTYNIAPKPVIVKVKAVK